MKQFAALDLSNFGKEIFCVSYHLREAIWPFENMQMHEIGLHENRHSSMKEDYMKVSKRHSTCVKEMVRNVEDRDINEDLADRFDDSAEHTETNPRKRIRSTTVYSNSG